MGLIEGDKESVERAVGSAPSVFSAPQPPSAVGPERSLGYIPPSNESVYGSLAGQLRPAPQLACDFERGSLLPVIRFISRRANNGASLRIMDQYGYAFAWPRDAHRCAVPAVIINIRHHIGER